MMEQPAQTAAFENSALAGEKKADKKAPPPPQIKSSGKSRKSSRDSGKGEKKPLPVIKIRDEYCKGCGICIAFCPTQVLGMKAGKATVLNLEACTSCTFCELRCPDFAITVE